MLPTENGSCATANNSCRADDKCANVLSSPNPQRLLRAPRGSWCRLQRLCGLVAHIGRQVIELYVLAELERTNVGCDCPPIARRNLPSVIGHRTVAVGRDIEEVADRHFCGAALDIRYEPIGENYLTDRTAAS